VSTVLVKHIGFVLHLGQYLLSSIVAHPSTLKIPSPVSDDVVSDVSDWQLFNKPVAPQPLHTTFDLYE